MDWFRILERPTLPGEAYIEGQQRVEAKRRVIERCQYYPDSFGDTCVILDHDWSPLVDERVLISWMRVWLLSDNDLYFCFETWHKKRASNDLGYQVDWDWLKRNVSPYNFKKAVSLLRQQLQDRLGVLSLVCESVVETGGRLPPQYVGIQRVYEVPTQALEATEPKVLKATIPKVEKSLRCLLTKVTQCVEETGDSEIYTVGPSLELLDAANALSIKLNAITPTVLPGYGKAFIATTDIQPDECVMALPEENLMSHYTCLLSGFKEPRPATLRDATFGHSLAFVAAFLLGARFVADPKKPPFPDVWCEKHPRLRELYEAQPCDTPLVEEQLFLVFSLLIEGRKGKASPFCGWIESLDGYADGCVPTDSQNLLYAPDEMIEFIDSDEVAESLREVNECIPRFHMWLKDLLPPLFPHLFSAQEFDDSEVCDPHTPPHTPWFSLKRFIWAWWVSESREFESVLLPPLTFAHHIPWDRLTDKAHWTRVLLNTFTDIYNEEILSRDKTWTTPELPILPGFQYLDGSLEKPKKAIALPVMIGWTETGEQIIEMMSFNVCRTVAFLLPVVDYMNHDARAQCSHPSIRLSDRLTLGRLLPNDLKRVGDVREALLSTASRKIKVFVECSVKKGSQVFISYGPHECRSLLRFYGFCPAVTDDIDTMNLVLDIEGVNEVPELKGLPTQHLLSASSDPAVFRTLVQYLGTVSGSTESPAREEEGVKLAQSIVDQMMEPVEQKLQLLKYWMTPECAVSPDWVQGWGHRVASLLTRNLNVMVNAKKGLAALVETAYQRTAV